MLYRRHVKRWLDLAITFPALLVSAPVLLLIALLVRVSMGAPVLFRQQRPGLYARPFTLLKFRTMTSGASECADPASDDARLTPLGRWLRSTSLDELPELLNVLRGEMSLVGPRPLLMQYLTRYNAEQMRRHDVRPGITGWAQVNGRNTLTWPEKFALDVWYADHVSLPLDLTIVALTFWKVLRREDINQPGQATIEEFMGS